MELSFFLIFRNDWIALNSEAAKKQVDRTSSVMKARSKIKTEMDPNKNHVKQIFSRKASQ